MDANQCRVEMLLGRLCSLSGGIVTSQLLDHPSCRTDRDQVIMIVYCCSFYHRFTCMSLFNGAISVSDHWCSHPSCRSNVRATSPLFDKPEFF